MMKGQRRQGNGFDLSEAPSHLIRRCQQFYGDLYAREAGGKELTKQQFTLLCALEQNDGTSQTALVEITGIDRSTLAEMVRRMLEKGLLSRERTEEDQRANAVAISPAGRKALRGARNAADRAEETVPCERRRRWITAHLFCKAGTVKICAWTSAHKTVLTAASGPQRLSCNPKTGHDRAAHRVERQSFRGHG